MAANFWTSNHSKGLISRSSLGTGHAKDHELWLTDDQIYDIKSFHVNLIVDIAKNLKLRQRAIGTAVVYFRRFYTKNCFADHDPRLVAQACLYLAAKAEECTVQMKALKHYLEKRQQRYGTLGVREFTVKEVLDYELLVLEELEYNLVVFSPYRPLVLFVKDAELPQEMIDTSWALLNDMYYTDLPLAYAPHVLALGAISTAAVIRQKDINGWMKGLRVDLNQVYEIATEMLNLYESFRKVISQDECYRLLISIQQAKPKEESAAAAPTPPTATVSTPVS